MPRLNLTEEEVKLVQASRERLAIQRQGYNAAITRILHRHIPQWEQTRDEISLKTLKEQLIFMLEDSE